MAEVRSVLRTGALAELQPLLHNLEDANVEKEPKQARHEAHATQSTPAFAATLPHAGARSDQAVATHVDMLVSSSPGAAASSGSTLPHPASEVQQPQQISQQTMLQMQQVIQQHIQQPQQIRQQIPLSASMATIMGAMTPVTSSVPSRKRSRVQAFNDAAEMMANPCSLAEVPSSIHDLEPPGRSLL